MPPSVNIYALQPAKCMMLNCHRRKLAAAQGNAPNHSTDTHTNVSASSDIIIDRFQGECHCQQQSLTKGTMPYQFLKVIFQDNKPEMAHDEIVQEGETFVINKSYLKSNIPANKARQCVFYLRGTDHNCATSLCHKGHLF